MRKGLIIGLLLTAMTAGAVKMQPGFTKVKQSDGTTITVRAFGDEDFSYFMAADGTLLYQKGTDFFIAAIGSDGKMKPSGILAHNPEERSAKELSQIKLQNREAFFKAIN